MYKTHAVKAQALLGAKEYVARVESDPRRYYCAEGWRGCILTEAMLAVNHAAARVLTRYPLDPWSQQTLRIEPHLLCTDLLGLAVQEQESVYSRHDLDRNELGHYPPSRLRQVVREAYDALAAIPVEGEAPTPGTIITWVPIGVKP